MSDYDLRVDDRPILVSQQEIAKRRHADAITAGSFAVDNISMSSDTKHLFCDYVEGRIATNKDLVSLLHAHYSKLAALDRSSNS